jgi:hypothetical protein
MLGAGNDTTFPVCDFCRQEGEGERAGKRATLLIWTTLVVLKAHTLTFESFWISRAGET